MDKRIDLGTVREYREIKITSKRQITIPKSFFDNLAIEETFQAYLLDDGIFLKPIQKTETVYDQDIQSIIRQVIKEGYSGEEFVGELTYRISEYNKLIERRIQEFQDDLRGSSGSDELGDDDFNGLDIFFYEEARTTDQETRKEAKDSD